MATKTSWQKFKQWGKSHSLHQPTTKLPLRLTIEVDEDVVDFMHGCLIGLLIGFMLGLFFTKTLGLF